MNIRFVLLLNFVALGSSLSHAISGPANPVAIAFAQLNTTPTPSSISNVLWANIVMQLTATRGTTLHIDSSETDSEQLALILNAIPALIRHHITELDISNNHITYLPQIIGDLVQLDALVLDANPLLDLTGIGYLNSLSVLSAIGNQLETLPFEMAQLDNLALINLSEGPLTGDISVLAALPALAELTLNAELEHRIPAFDHDVDVTLV